MQNVRRDRIQSCLLSTIAGQIARHHENANSPATQTEARLQKEKMSLIIHRDYDQPAINRGSMSKRARRRRAARKVKEIVREHQRVELEKPVGAGVVAVIEEFAEIGRSNNSKRWRNRGEHPLELAYYRKRLDGPGPDGKHIGLKRFEAGEFFRKAFEATMTPGRSSMEPAIGGASPTARTTLADAQIDASRFIARLRDAMGETATYRIIEAFCGHGYSMVDALRLAEVPFAPQGVLPRILESLDVLARVISKPLPPIKRHLDDDR